MWRTRRRRRGGVRRTVVTALIGVENVLAAPIKISYVAIVAWSVYKHVTAICQLFRDVSTIAVLSEGISLARTSYFVAAAKQNVVVASHVVHAAHAKRIASASHQTVARSTAAVVCWCCMEQIPHRAKPLLLMPTLWNILHVSCMRQKLRTLSNTNLALHHSTFDLTMCVRNPEVYCCDCCVAMENRHPISTGVIHSSSRWRGPAQQSHFSSTFQSQQQLASTSPTNAKNDNEMHQLNASTEAASKNLMESSSRMFTITDQPSN